MPKSYSQVISEGDVLTGAIKNNLDKLKDVNLTAEKAEAMDAMLSSLRALNVKQEQLKSDLKACTAEVNDKIAELSAAIADAKKRVKLCVPKEDWVAYGISAKK